MNAPVATRQAPAVDSAIATVGMDPQLVEAKRIQTQIEAVKAVIAPDLTNQEMLLFAMVAQRLHLDPFVRQIHAIKRQGKLSFQTGIDGFRSSAEETELYRGSTEPEFGPIIEAPFKHPEFARVGVHRADSDGTVRTQYHTAYWDELYPGQGAEGFMWRKMPRNQLAKCAEAGAFRKQFPKRFAGLYEPAEMEQADAAAAEAARPVGPTAAARVHGRREAIEAASATTQGSDSGAGAAREPKAAHAAEQPADPEQDTPSAARGSAGVASDAVEGQYVEAPADAEGLTAGYLRDFLREHRIAIPFALDVARQNWGKDVPNLDALTDQQRAQLRDDLAK